MSQMSSRGLVDTAAHHKTGDTRGGATVGKHNMLSFRSHEFEWP